MMGLPGEPVPGEGAPTAQVELIVALQEFVRGLRIPDVYVKWPDFKCWQQIQIKKTKKMQ